jgi:hypothetical protein
MRVDQDREPSFLSQLIAITEAVRVYIDAREPSATSLLEGARIRVSSYDFDNWNGGTYLWRFTYELSPDNFAVLQARGKLEQLISDALQSVMQERFAPDVVGSVSVVPRLDVVSSTHPKPTGINNQGRGHSQNPAALPYEGLNFRSRSEVCLYRQLKRAGLLIAPLPVFIKEKATRPRVEPDFIVVKSGVMLVVEIDGGSHTERPVDAQERLAAFEEEGFHVYRVKAVKTSRR